MPQTSPEGSRGRDQFQNSLRMAIDSIRSHKLRSFLTLLGVIIGVASVILVGAAIAGWESTRSRAPPRRSGRNRSWWRRLSLKGA